MSQTATCVCILSLVTLLGCSEEKASQLPDGGPIKAAVDAGAPRPSGQPTMDGGLDAGQRDASRGRDDEDDVKDDEPSDDSDDEGDRDDDDADADAGPAQQGAIKLAVPGIDDDGMLSADYRCDDNELMGVLSGGISPEISWTPGPPGTKSYAVTIRAINANLFAHWTIFDIAADVTTLPAHIPLGTEITDPLFARQAKSHSRSPATYGYFGPCGNGQKEFELSVHALDVAELPGLDPMPLFEDAEEAIDAHTIVSTSTTFSSAPLPSPSP